jgi:hypothetical protein
MVAGQSHAYDEEHGQGHRTGNRRGCQCERGKPWTRALTAKLSVPVGRGDGLAAGERGADCDSADRCLQ